MRERLLIVGLAGWLLGACPHRVEPPTVHASSLRLLADTPERETTQWPERRTDLEFDVEGFDRTPRVVASGETGLIDATGAEVQLSGDEAGTKGFSVDNCVFLEVLAPDGKVVGKAVVGFTDGLSQGSERIDALGRRAFSFEANEVSLTTLVPEHGLFKLRATVLDYGGVGRVSDVYVRVTPRARAPDELRGQ